MSYVKQLAGDIAQVLADIELTNHTRRDRWGRYMAKADTAKKPKAFTRATTVAGTNEDTYNLQKRGNRYIVAGLAVNADLVAAVRALDPESDKDALDKICKSAAHQAGADFKAEYGTALHHCFAMSILNPDYVAPESFVAEVAKIHAALALHGLTIVAGMVERMILNRRLGIAGTFDLIVTDGIEYLIADVKTGNLAFGALKMAIQGSIYAQPDNVIYNQGSAADGSEDTEEPMPKVSANRALIINVPFGQPCTLHWLDLSVGDEGLRLALETRAMRNAKPLEQIATPEVDVVERTKQIAAAEKILAAADGNVDDEWRAWMTGRLKTLIDAGHAQLIRNSWPEGVPTLGSGKPIANHLAEPIEQAVSMIERQVGAEFPDIKPGEVLVERREAAPQRRGAPDEGDEVGTAETQVVNKHARKLTVEGRTPHDLKTTINNHYNGSFLEPWGERSRRGYGIEVIERFAREVAYVELGGGESGRAARLVEMAARDYNDLSADRQVVAAVEAMEAILAKAAAGEPNGVVEVNGRSGGLALFLPGKSEPEMLYQGSV